MNAYTRCLLATSATLLLAFPASAQVQEVPAQADGAGLGDIVVTAQKRSENLQDVPISMSVVSAQSIERSHALTLGDLQSSAPNFQLTENTGIKTVNIRGVGGGGRNVGFDPRVGIYIDGVYMSNPPSVDSVLLDLDRVEILRGPQGFLFGQNSDAGAVSLVTKAPANDSFAKFVASYGNKDALVLSAILNTPLVSDVALLKVAFARNSRDGFTKNVFNGKFVDDVQDTSGRVQLRLLPSDDVTVDFSLDGSVQKSHFVTGEPRTDTFGAGPPPTPGPFFINANTPELDKNTNIGGSVTIAWQTGENTTLTSISAYRTSKRKWLSDLDHSPAFLSDFVYNDRYKTFSQELRLASTAFDDNLKYIVGAYFQSDSDQSSRIVGFGPDIEAVPFGVDRNSKIISLPGVDKTNYALFGSADYKLAETLTLNSGIRVDVSKKSLLLNQDGRTTSGILFSPTVIGYIDNLSETNVTPTIGLNWKASPDVTLYAKYARGVKGGGFNADFVNGTQPAPGALRFAKENVDSFEIGLKSELFDRSLRFNLAGFYSEYSNYQVSQFIQVNGLTSAVIGNAGKVQTYGPELSMQFMPVKGLTLSADGAWLHAKYLSFVNGGGIGIDYTGNVTEYAPKVTASVAADYTTPTGWGDTDVFLHLAYSYRSSQYTQPSMSQRFRLQSYSLLNGSIGIGSEAQGWQFQIFGKNLTNERYDANLSQDAFGTLIGKRGTPRTYGGEVRLQF